MYLNMCGVGRYMEISMYLNMCGVGRYMEISMCRSMCSASFSFHLRLKEIMLS